MRSRLVDIQLSDIGQIIQLAIAAVFLLTGVGTMLVERMQRLKALSRAV